MTEFKLIVAGSRGFTDFDLLIKKVVDMAEGQLKDRAVSIVSGMAKGPDMMGYLFAKDQGITCYEFPANWDKYGKGAGYRRNAEMADFADGLLAFWDGKSRGTKHMIDQMTAKGKVVRVVIA